MRVLKPFDAVLCGGLQSGRLFQHACSSDTRKSTIQWFLITFKYLQICTTPTSEELTECVNIDRNVDNVKFPSSVVCSSKRVSETVLKKS